MAINLCDRKVPDDTQLPVKEERNMGVELFRIVSMILVVMLHVLGHGGVYARTELLSDNYKVAWFMEAFAYCSVNCYALISGYANVKSGFKFRRFVRWDFNNERGSKTGRDTRQGIHKLPAGASGEHLDGHSCGNLHNIAGTGQRCGISLV